MLTQPRSISEFKFDFNMDTFAFISIALLKYDKNLSESREKLVPEEVEEEEFWYNYFYAIESFKVELGLPNRLGDKIGEEERIQNIEEEAKKYEEPLKNGSIGI